MDWPELKSNWDIEFRNDWSVIFSVDSSWDEQEDDSGNCHRFRWERSKITNSDVGRWRWFRGPFCSLVSIAREAFVWPGGPNAEPTNEMKRYMEGKIEFLGNVLDVCLLRLQEKRRDFEKRRMELSREHAQFVLDDFDRKVEIFSTQEKTPSGFVYMMEHVNGLTKIGYSKNPRVREKTLQAEDPRLKLVWKVRAYRDTELRLHRVFDDVRKRGEWFDLKNHHKEWVRFLVTENGV